MGKMKSVWKWLTIGAVVVLLPFAWQKSPAPWVLPTELVVLAAIIGKVIVTERRKRRG